MYPKFLEKIAKPLQKISVELLRISFGVVFIWFGLLKVFGLSPVEELVFRATHWMGTHEIVIFLGIFETLLGICFLFRKTVFIGLILFFFLLPGTFFPLYFNPEDCFTVFPYGLTLEGQYIFKNFILFSAALVILSSLPFKRDKS